MEKCTLCGKEFNNIYIDIELDIKGNRKTLNETYEEIPNSRQKSRERLCRECFDKFVDSLSETMLGEKLNV